MSKISQEKLNEMFDEILAPTVMSPEMSSSEKVKMIMGLWQLVKVLNIDSEFEIYLKDNLMSKSKYTIEGAQLALNYK